MLTFFSWFIAFYALENQDFTLIMLRSDRSVWRADPFARLYSGTWSQKQARFMQWQTGTTQARQRVILGQAWVFDRQTISNRARQRDNPGTQAIVQARCKQSPNGKAKG